MGVYINIIKGANVKAKNEKGEKIQINHAPYFGKCWSDSWVSGGQPSCLEETKSFKAACRAADRRKKTDLVCFSIPEFDGRYETHDCYRNIRSAYYDTPDYTNEGPVAIMKAFPEGNLVVPRYAEGYDECEEKWVPIRISEIFPYGSRVNDENPLELYSVHAEFWDEEIGQYWFKHSLRADKIRFSQEDKYPKGKEKSRELPFG